MTVVGGKKALPLCILEVLKNHSSKEHPLLIQDIIDHLDRDFGMQAGRNAISRNLSLLREMGYEICEGPGGRGVYAEPLFSDGELRVLIDSVLLSRYIAAPEARELIDKLQSMGSKDLSSGMRDIHAVDKWNRTHNTDFFERIDLLSEAVQKHLRITFLYSRVGLDGQLHSDGRLRKAHPLSLLCAQGQYYLLACYEDSQEVRHFRVDHISDLHLTDEPALTPYDLPDFRTGVDMARYAAEHRYMYSGEPVRVVLRMPVTAAGQVCDAFGSHAAMSPCADHTHMEVRLTSSLENMRIFALQYASVCEVLSPKELRKLVRKDMEAILKKYESQKK